MIRYWKEGVVAVALALGLAAGRVDAADVKPLINAAGAVQPIHSGDTLSVPAAKVTGISGSTQCVQANSAGLLSGTGSSCGGSGSPGGSSGQIQYNNTGAFGGFTASGDATINTGTGAVAVTKTGGVSFAASATTDTTNAGNISSGVLGSSRGGAGSVSGLLKANGSGAVSAATSGTDYAPATSGSSILSGNGSGGFSSVTVGSGLSFSGGTLSATGGAGLPSIASGHVIGNGTGSTATAADSTLTSVLDQAFGSTQGGVLYRGASVWSFLSPGTSGQVLTTSGASANPSWQSVSVSGAGDYSSGTWTPGVAFGGGTTGITYTNQVGRYVKIGNLVIASCYINISAKGSSTGSLTITGLPFATKNTTLYEQAATFGLVGGGNTAAPHGWADPNTTVVKVYKHSGGGFYTQADFIAFPAEIIMTFTYEAN